MYDNAGPEKYTPIRQALTEQFDGGSADIGAPAAGLWKDDDQTVRDDVVVYEVMVKELNRAWWAAYRETLRGEFGQEALVVRAQAVGLL